MDSIVGVAPALATVICFSVRFAVRRTPRSTPCPANTEMPPSCMLSAWSASKTLAAFFFRLTYGFEAVVRTRTSRILQNTPGTTTLPPTSAQAQISPQEMCKLFLISPVRGLPAATHLPLLLPGPRGPKEPRPPPLPPPPSPHDAHPRPRQHQNRRIRPHHLHTLRNINRIKGLRHGAAGQPGVVEDVHRALEARAAGRGVVAEAVASRRSACPSQRGVVLTGRGSPGRPG